MNIALGVSLDNSNIELEKLTNGPVNYAISHTEFSLPVKQVKVDGKNELNVVFPQSLEEMRSAQYIKVEINAVPKEVIKKAPTTRPPMQDLEGIDPKIAEKLRKIKITTLSELATSTAKTIVRKAKIKDKEAQAAIGTAKFIVRSRLAGVEGLDADDAELLTSGAMIRTVNDLAKSKPQELYSKLKKIIETKVAKVPKTYELSLEKVQRWVLSAKLRIPAKS